MTPDGKLQNGDKIRSPDGAVYIVTERLGNDISYSVRIRKEDGTKFTSGEASGRLEKILLNVSWKLKHGWEFIGEGP